MDQQTLIQLSKLNERSVEDRFYELALSEIEENSFDPVAKAKAFEEAEGEEKKSHAFYVKHRVRRMKDELAAFILNEAEKQKSQNELDRKQAAIAADKAKQLALEGERLLRLAYLTKHRKDRRLVRERKKLILICALVCGATFLGYFTNGISGALSLGLPAAVVSAFVIYSFNKGQS